jgi:polyisoprenoid-binding protein YceI
MSMSTSGIVVDPGQVVQMTAATGEWALDPSASQLRLAAKTFWGLVTVRGHLAGLDGSVHVGDDGGVTASLAIDASSVDTKLKKRDAHLRSAHFFDASTHPYLTARIGQVTFSSTGTAIANGELTVASRTQPVRFEATVTFGADQQEAVVETSLDVDHRLFGMSRGLFGMVRPITRVEARLVFRKVFTTG